ncbi:transglutaminase domain-containing protein [Schaalia canis]|uniref:Transglutaminase domain-containing protein n=1 Tax=Schaalia canis TaxID=100469 RepID=A0A3P1SEV7_9ACTO|nr:transglutaminase domain-containing protein [Schaalia canis]RRC95539.1 transglutaminase domain-containing protein [Schaalia canis]
MNTVPTFYLTTSGTDKKQHRRYLVIDLALVLVLLLIAGVTHGDVFGDSSGYIAASGGVGVGFLCALIAARAQFGPAMSTLVLIAGYLAAGPYIALPDTLTRGVFPTLASIRALVTGSVTAWKDLLTIQPPAEAFSGMTVVPYLSGLVAAFVSVTIVVRTQKRSWAILPIVVFATIGILWGSQRASYALAIGIVGSIIAWVWTVEISNRRRHADDHSSVTFVNNANQSAHLQRTRGAVVVILAAVTAALVVPLLPTDHRLVLRDYVDPPLDLHEYHSPLAFFRAWNTQEADTALFTVEGLGKDERIRIATLDFYDGTIFKTSGEEGAKSFRHVGRDFTDVALPEGSETRTLTFALANYEGNWLPTGGQVRSLEYTAGDIDSLASALFYSEELATALSVRPLGDGVAYRSVSVLPKPWADAKLQDKPFEKVPLPDDLYVPESVHDTAQLLTEGKNAGIEQVRALQQRLHDDGFYSDGLSGNSLPGHRSDRLAAFLEAPQMVGDDDQYAPAMALMLRSLGIPSRVVMGFYPETYTDGPIPITGKDTHVWVEVPFRGAGWVPFDPTPPKDQVPQTEVPKPKPNPRPLVIQPPEPPEEPAEVPPESVEDPEDDDEPEDNGWGELLLLIVKIGAGISIVLLPFIVIVLIKSVMRLVRRRRKREDLRAAAAWDEVVDRVTDLGIEVSMGVSRPRQAQWIERQLTAEAHDETTKDPELTFVAYDAQRSELETLADELDRAVFSAPRVSSNQCDDMWARSIEVIKSLRKRASWRQRLGGTFSTKALRMRAGRRRNRRRREKKLIAQLKAAHKRGGNGSVSAVTTSRRRNHNG